jgi:hypothetical protein
MNIDNLYITSSTVGKALGQYTLKALGGLTQEQWCPQ